MHRSLYSLTALLLCNLFATLLPGQNLVPNPGFETFSVCPTALGQVNAALTSWSQANTATPDYANCAFNGNVAIRMTPASGTGVVGSWGSVNNGNCPGNSWSENVQATLVSPTMAGSAYTLAFDLMVDNLGFSTNPPNGCQDFGLYLYQASNPPTVNGRCCLTNIAPQLLVSGAAVLQGTYTTFSMNVTTPLAFDRIVIGPFCNAATGTAACATNMTMYFNVDNIVVQPTVILPEEDFYLNGANYIDHNRLQFEVPSVAALDFRLERSEDGVAFARVATMNRPADAVEGQLLEFRDEGHRPVHNFYRISALTADGQIAYSNVVEIANGSRATTGEQPLEVAMTPDGAVTNLGFELPEAEGFEIIVNDVNGREVYRAGGFGQAGHNRFNVPSGAWSPGIYLLRVKTAEAVWIGKALRMR